MEAILLAWHERQITGHLENLAEVRDRAGRAGERLEAVLEAYAFFSRESHGTTTPSLPRFCIETSTPPERSSSCVT